MNTAELLSHIQERGVHLEPKANGLYCKARRGVLTKELRELLTQHKGPLLDVLHEMRQMAGDEWDRLTEPERQALTRAIQIRRMRERGEVPAHYTATTICDHCGPVPSFPGIGPRVAGCVWCFRRAKGLPVPRPRSMLENKT